MKLAVREALAAQEHGDVPVGAVLVRSGRVLARGHNTRDLLGDPSGHAEINALRLGAQRTGSWRLDGCELFVTLEPCPMCAGAVVAARIDRLVFGAFDAKAGACGTLYNIPEDPRLNHRTTVVRGVLAEECAEPLARFFGERRAGGGGGGI